MQRRQLSLAVVEEILKNPSEIIEEKGKAIYQGIIADNGKIYLVRIFVNTDKNPNMVITAYKTSQIRKYYEGKI